MDMLWNASGPLVFCVSVVTEGHVFVHGYVMECLLNKRRLKVI
jgi:hypothetical protein